MSSSIYDILSVLLPLAAVLSLLWPHLVPWGMRAVVLPAACLFILMLSITRSRSPGPVVVTETPTDAVTQPEKRKIRRLNELEVELMVVESQSLHAKLGTPQIYCLLLAGLLLLDHAWRSHAFPCKDTIYARTVAASEHSVTLGLRMPGPQSEDIWPVQISYKPRAECAQWELADIVLGKTNDWRGLTVIDGLAAGTIYDYRLQSAVQSYPNESLLNFTTFPTQGANFRFIFSSAAKRFPLRYHPLAWLPRKMLPPSWTPALANLEQPAWRALGQWLKDMDERVAWAPTEFAIVGDTELGGSAESLDNRSQHELQESRRFLNAQAVRDVYERLPIFPARVESPCSGSNLQPGALCVPNRDFQFGDAAYYRLAGPPPEHSQEDTDWSVYLVELREWIFRHKATDDFKFIISPLSLAPFFAGSKKEEEWRQQVMKLLKPLYNVIVLAESPRYFAASVLRRSIIEVAAPPLIQAHALPWARNVLPNLQLAHSESVGRWVNINGEVDEEITYEAVDNLLAYEPLPLGPQWLSVEVNSARKMPSSVIKLIGREAVLWSLEVVGVRQSRNSMAVGSVVDGLQALLRKLGLWSVQWM